MNKIEKQKKFHETLLNIFYPPPKQRQPSQQEDEQEQASVAHKEDLNADLLSDVFKDSENSSPDDMSDPGSQKLTRAQRKRLRRKKLKEAASKRRKIIGPLLPSTNGGEDLEDKEPVSLHEKPMSETIRNDAQKSGTGQDEQGESHVCIAQSKLKQRRKGKKLGRNREDCSDVNVSHPPRKDEGM